ncbi:MAG: glycosyltransferase family 8 protein [Dysgonomonas sp.]
MNIVCCIDNKYIKHCIVTIVSLIENNRDENIDIYIVSQGLTKENEDLLRDVVVNSYKNNINFCTYNEELLEGSFSISDETKHISISTYLRFFLPQILPQSLSKVLYIDCDIIVRKSIRDLWNTDISNYAVGCIEDVLSEDSENHDRLGYPEKFSYFNAGVLLINLDYWRKNDIQNKLVEYVLQNPQKLRFNDQDALNAVLFDQKLFVAPKWNMMDAFFFVIRKAKKIDWNEIDAEMYDPAIVHYNGPRKPWSEKCLHPYRKEYFKYLDMTKWKGDRPKISFSRKLEAIFYPIAIKLKLDKPKYRNISKK